MSNTIKKKYTKSRAVSKQCRNHGKCSYCANGRMHKHNKKLDTILQQLKELKL
jgi:hypothetical protein